MTVLTSSGYGAISSIGPAKVYRTKTGHKERAKVTSGNNKFDSVTISTPSQDSRFLGLVGKLSQEVRAATTTGDIASLRQQVADREYSPDPAAIAARIMFLGEGQ